MNLFSFIKSRLSILDVVNEYVTLKKAGLYYKGTCPFHGEKTASFTVSPHKEIFYCFGCNSAGDVISFIAKAENISQFEAAQHLIERYGLEIPESISSETKSHESHTNKKRYYELCKTVAEWSHHALSLHKPALEYFKKRGFTQNTLDHFGIGYFTGGISAMKNLISHVGTKQFLANDLINAHIIAENKHSFYSPFEERLIFPIKDHLGNHCGFGGRIFKEQDERAKYYNSRENEFFNKGALLFGFELAKKSMQETHAAFMVEGYTDCMAMVQHGYTNTVATLGTACTLEHLKLLSRYVNVVYVVYDGDAAGQKAMLRMAELCWEVNLDPYVINLPTGDDPASYLAKKGSLEEAKAQAKDIFLFYIDSLGASFSRQPLSEKLRNSHKILDIVKNISDPFKRDILLQQAAETLAMPFDSLKTELLRLLDTHKPVVQTYNQLPQVETNPTKVDLNAVSLLEKKLFSVILSDIMLLTKTNSDYAIKHFSPPLRTILEKVYTAAAGKTINFMDFFTTLPQDEQQIVSRLLVECEEEDPGKTFEHLLTQFQKKHWKSIVSDIKLRLTQAEHEENDQKVKELLATFEELKKKLLSKGLL